LTRAFGLGTSVVDFASAGYYFGAVVKLTGVVTVPLLLKEKSRK
jgi:hypothetical protein